MKHIVWMTLFSTLGFAVQTTYNCTFTAYATTRGYYKKDGLKFKIVADDQSNIFTIKRANDSTKGKIIKGQMGLSFAEVSEKGNITVTTIAQVPPLEKAQKAVHSQNVLVAGKLLASQHYGTCQYVDPRDTKKRHVEISKLRRHEIYQKLHIDMEISALDSKDRKYVFEALSGSFPSKQEMEEEMSINGMILVSKIMEEVMRTK